LGVVQAVLLEGLPQEEDMTPRKLRFGLALALGFGCLPASHVFAQDSSASPAAAAPTTLTGDVSGSAASGYKLALAGGPIVAGAPRTFDLTTSDPQTAAALAGAVGQGVMDLQGTLQGTTLAVTSVSTHAGLLPLALPARPAATATTLTGNVSGSAASGYTLALAGGPIVAGAPRTFDLTTSDPQTAAALAGAVGQGVMDVAGTLQGTTLAVTSLSPHTGLLPRALPAQPTAVTTAADPAATPALPVLVVTSVKKHEGALPLARPATASTTTSVTGNVSGSAASGFTLAAAGGPIVAGAPRVFKLEASGANQDALADAASGGYLVDVNGTLDPKAASTDTSVTGSVSGDASSGFSLERAGGPIIVGEQRTFPLKGHGDLAARQAIFKELGDAATGSYLVTVTGKLVNGAIRVSSVTRFSGLLPLTKTLDAPPTGKGIINTSGLDSPPR
jgi:hypothetical protein